MLSRYLLVEVTGRPCLLTLSVLLIIRGPPLQVSWAVEGGQTDFCQVWRRPRITCPGAVGRARPAVAGARGPGTGGRSGGGGGYIWAGTAGHSGVLWWEEEGGGMALQVQTSVPQRRPERGEGGGGNCPPWSSFCATAAARGGKGERGNPPPGPKFCATAAARGGKGGKGELSSMVQTSVPQRQPRGGKGGRGNPPPNPDLCATVAARAGERGERGILRVQFSESQRCPEVGGNSSRLLFYKALMRGQDLLGVWVSSSVVQVRHPAELGLGGGASRNSS